MTTAPIVTRLAGLQLPSGGDLLRDHVRPESRRSAHYLERFDRTTLVYDCVHLPERGSYVFTAPRMLNLWAPFRDGLRIGGVRPRLRRRRWLRCEQVEAFAPEGPVTVELPGLGVTEIAARRSVAAAFAGRRSLLAVNRNNALGWIADWAGYYARAHGADAVVLFDNGSDAYSVDELGAVLAGVPGIAQAAVFSAPYPYGPTDRSKPLEVSPRFFQSAMLNVARRDALARAAGVLSVDIDEIARSRSGVSVFDLAARRRAGMVTIQGSWVYPAPGTEGAVGHGAHVWRRVPDRKCNRKWCLVPGGFMDRFGWAVHQIGGVLQNLLTEQGEVGLLHCFGTTTGWKSKRLELPEPLERDAELADFMAAWFAAGDGTGDGAGTAGVSPGSPAPGRSPAATS